MHDLAAQNERREIWASAKCRLRLILDSLLNADLDPLALLSLSLCNVSEGAKSAEPSAF